VVERKQQKSDALVLKPSAVAPTPVPSPALPPKGAVIITMQTLPMGHSTSHRSGPDVSVQQNAPSVQRNSISQMPQPQPHPQPRPTENAAVLPPTSRSKDAQQLYDTARTRLRGVVKSVLIVSVPISLCVILVCVPYVRQRWSYGIFFYWVTMVNTGVIHTRHLPTRPTSRKPADTR